MRLFLAAGAALSLAACYDTAAEPKAATDAKPAAEAPLTPNYAVQPLKVMASDNPEGQAIDKAEFIAGGKLDAAARKRLTIRLQVLLDRAHFSPGVIDGEAGENMRQAIAALERANALPVDGQVDAAVWAKLTADAQPVMTDYVITEEDVKGPFVAKIPTDYKAMAKLERLSYSGPLEALAEKFHMDEDLLKALNPEADFTKAGTTILVAAPGNGDLGAEVAKVEVDKAERETRAYAADGRLLAVYPATVGSTDMPTPEGEWEVLSVTEDPVWNYDPAKLNFGDKSAGKLTIPAGPNNPVGLVWIDLSKDTYGIHGAPNPEKVGKTDSHGCVRLTNWDAKALGRHVAKGTKVVFVGSETSSST